MSKTPESDPRLLQPATPSEITSLINHAGLLFAEAHLAAGNIDVGEVPEASRVRFTNKDLKALPYLSHWMQGEIQYAPPIFLDELEPEDDQVVAPPSLVAIFSSRDPKVKGRQSTVNRTLDLTPTFQDNPATIWDSLVDLDDETLAQYSGLHQDAMRQFLDETFQKTIAQQEARDEEARLFGAGSITKGELQNLGRLMVGIVRPERLEPPQDYDKYDET